VVRILYPGPHPLIPALPADFVRVTGAGYTTDDLLLYLVGLHELPDRRAMLAKVDALTLPAAMREDLIAKLKGGEAEAPAAIATQTALAVPAARANQKATAKPAAPATVVIRRQQTRRL